ncbi:MAG: hypothetical protein RLZZ344_1263 [Pseudomonadota bacterium]|jgi:uncharacterized membrane-anchored protein
MNPLPSSHEHSQRQILHEEVHARPPIALWPEERVCSQAFLLTEPSHRANQKAFIESLTKALQTETHPVHGQNFRVLELLPEPSRILLKWELHGEFSTLTVYQQGTPEVGPDWTGPRQSMLNRMRSRLMDLGLTMPGSDFGERLSAVDIAIRRADPEDDAAIYAPLFAGNTLVGASILASGRAQIWTDFQLDPMGFIRILVNHQGMGSRQAGRVVQRLVDIDTYRMMAMLALPRAKGLSEPLRRAEDELAGLSGQIALAESAPVEQLQSVGSSPEGASHEAKTALPDHEGLLKGVSVLAARVEEWISAHGLRFTASEAYVELVRRAILELKETPLPGVQNVSEFMDRRFEPAMRTCRWTQRRLRELSDRVSRTTQILRTRIEFMNERQNQALLASMNRRAQLQLKLQQTVEGLSLVVLTYYSVGLVNYLAKGLRSLGLDLPVDLVTAIAVPVIAGLLLLGIRRARRRFAGPDAPL